MKNRILSVFSAILCLFWLTGVFADEAVKNRLELEEIIVTGTKTKHRPEDVPVDSVLIPRHEIEQSNAQNVSEIIANIPGFNFSQQTGITSAMGYKNTARGLNVESSYLLILVNGQRVFPGYRSGGMTGGGLARNINVVPIEMIEQIEIVKGPGSALYGSDAVVGVVNIITKQPAREPDRTVGIEYGSYEVKGADYLGNEPTDVNRSTQKIFATVSQELNESFGFSLNLTREQNEGIHPEKYDITQTYLHGIFDFKVTDELKLRLGTESANWGEKNDDLGDDKTETSNRYYSVIDYEFHPKNNVRLQIYQQGLDQDFKDPVYGDTESTVMYTDYEFQYTNRSFDNNILTVGYELLEEYFDSSMVDDKRFTTRSVYIQDEFTLFDKMLTIVPGVRADDSEAWGNETNPKLSVMIKPVEGTTIRTSAGKSFKPPSATQNYGVPFNHVYMWIFANPDLEPEKSTSWQASIDQWLMNQKIMISLTYYQMTVENMITQEARGDFIDDVPVMIWKNLNKAEISGIESMIGINLTEGLDLDLNYTLTKSEDNDTGEELVDTPEITYGANLRYTDGEQKYGGFASYLFTGSQRNMVYDPSMSEETESFSTVGLNLWFRVFNRGKVTLQADNLLDAELEGSDTIYAGQTLTAKLSVDL